MVTGWPVPGMLSFSNWMAGINDKIKAMLCLHYGLRNERFFRLRLFALHETQFRLTGC